MANKKSLEAIHESLKDICQRDELFGNVVVLLSGDFRQTLPVISRRTADDELNACLKQSHLWSHEQRFRLTTNMRVNLRCEAGAEAFSRRLLSIGDGTIPADRYSVIQFPHDLCQIVASVPAIVDKVFPDLAVNLNNHTRL